ncbi:hypothetical protein GL263_17625 [Streptomyces durbertensis]|uniref:ATP-binding protein n=1 Tax=Streptomyces durbertensis TaxID=2448886 RepID=A0ABR6EJ49_9ACTN|nr:hypothetical protein [Streptomyces durbertensis]MBB1245371.1 hypothetical protein [Streptomyces durbertensis]
MSNVLSRALSAAAVAGIATLAAAAPASASPAGLIGDNLQKIGLASEDTAEKGGDSGKATKASQQSKKSGKSGKSSKQGAKDGDEETGFLKHVTVLDTPVPLL